MINFEAIYSMALIKAELSARGKRKRTEKAPLRKLMEEIVIQALGPKHPKLIMPEYIELAKKEMLP